MTRSCFEGGADFLGLGIFKLNGQDLGPNLMIKHQTSNTSSYAQREAVRRRTLTREASGASSMSVDSMKMRLQNV